MTTTRMMTTKAKATIEAGVLFDLKEDPSEKRNLATENPVLVKELSSLLDEWYVPSQRQAGKFVSVAPKRKRQ